MQPGILFSSKVTGRKSSMTGNDFPCLMISDVDGTIFGREDVITEDITRLRDDIKKYRVPFTLASGRCLENLKPLMDYLGLSLPVVVNNGTGIVLNGKSIWKKSMPARNVKAAVEYADRCGMLVTLSDSVKESAYRYNPYVQSFIDRFNKKYRYLTEGDSALSEEKWESLSIEKILFIDPEKPGRMDTIIGMIKGLDEEVSVVKYSDRSLDVMPFGCSKENGIRRLAELTGHGLKDMLAVGDNENDINLLKEVGFGAAVGNATETLKKAADYVCRKNAAGGVDEVLLKFFAAKE
jgi:Cof subfamily protein (haloacid dehalogenase superfamily)